MAFRLLFRKPTNRVWEPKYDWADAVSKGLGKDVLNSLNNKDLGGPCAKVPKPPRRAGLIKS